MGTWDFWKRVTEGDTTYEGTPCWIWQGQVHERGYGRFTRNKKHHKVHRWAWMELRGEIPDGLTIDHLCRQKLCVNPWHMDVCPSSVNVKRQWQHVFDTEVECRRGHPRTPENTYTRRSGARECRRCKWPNR